MQANFAEELLCLSGNLVRNQSNAWSLVCGDNYCQWRPACIRYKRTVNHIEQTERTDPARALAKRKGISITEAATELVETNPGLMADLDRAKEINNILG